MRKVLIIEDNATFRKTFRDALTKRFPEMLVEELSDGSRIFEKIDTFQPGLIFMDIRLPGQNGLELTEKVKERYPQIRIVILTEYDLPEYREAACFGEADKFMTKGTLSLSDIAELLNCWKST